MAAVEDNPYVAFSTLAVGERFVGRRGQRLMLLRTVAAGRASCAIIGLPRVGKSSLARFVLDQAMHLDNVVAVWIGVGGIDDGQSILSALLDELPLPDDGPDERPDETRANDVLKRRLQDLRRAGRRVVAVFDEFDSVRQTLDPDLSTRRLRELVNDTAKYAFTAMLVCRRDLSVIEEQIPDLSNLANACQRLLLKGFDEEEFAELVARGFPDGLDAADHATLVETTGQFPILAEEALMHVYDGHPASGAASRLDGACGQLSAEWQHLLDNAGVWGVLLDVAREGTCDYGWERDQLLNYGLIVPDGSGRTSYRIRYEFLAARLADIAGAAPQRWSTDVD
ncbi:MAG: ATP-binding protein [Nocardioides sp.]|uniref:AAA family ATPase n=1 Tax=Nocardioides sp. TaxID=35761 RepID=UPI0039E3C334